MTPWHSEAQRQQVLCTGYHWENVFVGKAVVIRSFLWPGLRPRANRTVVTQLEKLQLFFFWQLVNGVEKEKSICSNTSSRGQFFIERSCKHSSTDLALYCSFELMKMKKNFKEKKKKKRTRQDGYLSKIS